MAARRLLAAVVAALSAGPAAAFITRTVPLKKVLADEQVIAVATVSDHGPPVSLTVTDSLKGRFPAAKLSLDFTGDALARREKHPEKLLPKLAKGTRVVLFASKERGGWTAFAFADGAWFRVRGTPAGDGFTWALVHGEPYLRRTFKGTSAELEAVVRDCLAGKRTPPEPDGKEPPGFGTPVDSGVLDGQGGRGKGEGGEDRSAVRLPPSPLFAVIPSFVLIGPLALVAALVPGLAARLAVGGRRWRAVLTVTGANTTLSLLYFWLRKYLPDAAWAGPTVLFGLLVVVTFGGLVWATRRADRLPSPPAGERKWLIAAAVGLGLFVAGVGWWAGWGELVRLPWAAFTAAAVGAGLTVFWRSEPVALFGTGVPLVGCGLVTQVNPPAPVDHPHEPPVRVLFETPDYDAVLSGLTVNDRRVYFGVSKQTGFRTAGAVLSVDLGTGRERWRFDADGTLRPVFATPTLGASGLLVGEGLHADSDCRVFALSTDTGRPKWDKPFQTAGHVEGSPGIIRIESYNQDVCVPAGADGLYRLNARTGLKKWHRTEPGLHVDTAPLADDRFNMRANLHSLAVYVGSGYGWKGVLKVDADTGQVIWRTPTDLRVFGQGFGTPSRVYFGLGSGTLTDDLVAEPDEPPAPAGAVVCLDNNTGAVVWQTGLPRSAHTGLASDGSRVFAACRDGSVYALDHRTGAVVWSRAVGGPFLAAPVVHSHGRLSVVTGDGRYAALNGDTGELHWTCDLSAPLGREVRAGSLVIGPGGERVLVGVGLTNRFNGATAAAIVEISP